MFVDNSRTIYAVRRIAAPELTRVKGLESETEPVCIAFAKPLQSALCVGLITISIPTRADMRHFANTYDEILGLIEKELQPEYVVLEVATGTGIIAIAISGKVSRVFATDISSAMIG